MKYNFDYGSTCGAIIDTSIFYQQSKLWDIPNDLPENITIYNIEDLWLSFVIKKYYNWEIKRSFLPEKITLNTNDKCNAHSLWITLKKEKQKLLEYLYYRNWEINTT